MVEFTSPIQHNKREENSNVMEGNKSKVKIQRRKEGEDIRKSRREISDECNVQII